MYINLLHGYKSSYKDYANADARRKASIASGKFLVVAALNGYQVNRAGEVMEVTGQITCLNPEDAGGWLYKAESPATVTDRIRGTRSIPQGVIFIWSSRDDWDGNKPDHIL